MFGNLKKINKKREMVGGGVLNNLLGNILLNIWRLKKKKRKKRRRRPWGLKQLIQDPDINSPILWQLGAEIKMLVLLGTAGDSWLFSELFAHWPCEQSSPVRMKCKDTNNVPAREWEMGNEQFGLFAQQKGSHNGRPMAFPCIKPLSRRPPFVAWFLLPRPDKSPAAPYF